jgi:carbamoyl-phosphate synthase large subunit
MRIGTEMLIFDEVNFESVSEIYEREQPYGVNGRSTPNNLAIRLHRAGVRILGTNAESIDTAEDRHKFSALLDQLASTSRAGSTSPTLPRPSALWSYPVLVRPSYVLSGAAMSVAREKNELLRILARARAVSPEHPVVVSRFRPTPASLRLTPWPTAAKIVLWAISEHVEDAGVPAVRQKSHLSSCSDS